MPRATPYPSNIHALISSISYPDLPGPSELDALRATLEQQSAAVAADLEKKLRREKKRKERDESNYPSEAAALEANGRAGMKLEALERARLESTAKRASPSTVKVKRERLSASPAPSNASSVSFRPPATHSQPITYGGTQLKKKKNRVLDSDDEAKSQARDRSTTLASPPPHLSHMNSTSVLKLKLNSGLPAPKGRPSLGHVDASPTPSGSTAAATHFPGAAIDFSLPPQTSKPLIPPRPGVQKPLKAGPKRQSEVDEDFSNTKAPNQVAFTTFWSSVEPYLRDIREDDLAMLEFKAEAPELYDIPPKGRHYTEIWDEEDGNQPGTTPRLNVPNTRQSHRATSTNHFVPVTEFKDEFLFDEQKGLGSLTERIVAAMVADVEGASVKREETAGRPIPEHEVTKEPSRVDVFDLEDRMKKELRALMLLGEHEEYDPSKRDDDEIASSLRQCQRLLLQQTAVNDARKTRLAEIARHRLAHGEYTNALEGIEKSIEAGWNKRVTKYKVTGKKNITPGTVPPLQSNRAPVPENLRRLVKVRQGWIENVGKLMKDRPKGEVNGLPTSSIYEGIGEDGGAEERDEKVVEDAMDIDSIADGEEVANGL